MYNQGNEEYNLGKQIIWMSLMCVGSDCGERWRRFRGECCPVQDSCPWRMIVTWARLRMDYRTTDIVWDYKCTWGEDKEVVGDQLAWWLSYGTTIHEVRWSWGDRRCLILVASRELGVPYALASVKTQDPE